MDGVVISEPMKSLVGIVDSLEREFNIDKNRVYVSGISMGGFGARGGCESGQAFGPDKW